MSTLAFRYRIYPTQTQSEMLAKHFGCVRLVYNLYLEANRQEYECSKKFLKAFTFIKTLPALKACDEYAFLTEVNSQSLQSAIRNGEHAFVNFFEKRTGFPSFKSKHARQYYRVATF